MTTYHTEGDKSLIQAFHCSEVHANQFYFMKYHIKYALPVVLLQKQSSGFYPMSYLQILSAITLLLVKLQIRFFSVLWIHKVNERLLLTSRIKMCLVSTLSAMGKVVNARQWYAVISKLSVKIDYGYKQNCVSVCEFKMSW